MLTFTSLRSMAFLNTIRPIRPVSFAIYMLIFRDRFRPWKVEEKIGPKCTMAGRCNGQREGAANEQRALLVRLLTIALLCCMRTESAD